MKYEKENILDIFQQNINNHQLIKAIFSNTFKKVEYTKLIIKPIKIKKQLYIQIESFKNNKVFHKNYLATDINNILNEIIDDFKQIIIFTIDKNIQILQNKNGFSIKTKLNQTEKKISFEHNKQKNYILSPNIPTPFLIKLGIMSKNGTIIKEKYNKFKQINRYLEIIDDCLKEMQNNKLIKNSITIVDFGCGKSYLTFALYHYLRNIKNFQADIIGLDLKDDVIEHCNNIAKELNFAKLKFFKGDIKNFHLLNKVDIVFSLHACNTATDYSILKGLELKAKAILAVPCCQSEFNQKINNSSSTELKNSLLPFHNNGLLQERFCSLATDAFRSLALMRCGYDTKVMEFIDMEHTPKNILIKAIKLPLSKVKIEEKKLEYDKYLDFLGITPLLDNLIQPYLLK